MATYKVPQDVEAEDKLLGPFSLKQLIFVLLFFGAAYMAFVLSRIAIPLATIMLPFLVIFGVLGFVHRKDQPVEVYLAALIRFYIKPHRRIWDQDGFDQRIVITAPKKLEIKRVRDITQPEVKSRLSNLANLMDSRGWAAKGLVTTPSDRLVKVASPRSELENAINTDIMDEQAKVSQKFEVLIEQQASDARLEAIERMHRMQATASEQLRHAPGVGVGTSGMHFNPYPSDMRQKVISPLGDNDDQTTTSAPADTAVPNQVSPDIIRLANNNDLTVSAIAREAHTLPSEEVVISLH
ncbi:MAG TPA: PrgI family protein [Candidatus Saccharimonadales bacterium]|nr:PrgI family protein [Candidatus Saccharimonadales bacterium]